MKDKKYINKSAQNELYAYLTLDFCLSDNSDEVINMPQVFHYTSPTGFESIIVNSKFWFTDSRFLNDVEEQYHIKSIIKEVLEKHKKDYKNDVINILEKYIEDENLTQLFDKKRRYIFSCSYAVDELSLWNYYVKSNNRGYSIGINPKQLLSSLGNKYSDKINVYKCIYSNKEKENMILNILNKANFALNAKGFQNNSKYKVLDLLEECIFMSSIIFKNEKFFSEKEIRFIYTPRTIISKPKFRLNNGIFVPYLELDFCSKSSIEMVTVGPGVQKDFILKGTKEFLYSQSIDIEINSSTIPIRNFWNT